MMNSTASTLRRKAPQQISRAFASDSFAYYPTNRAARKTQITTDDSFGFYPCPHSAANHRSKTTIQWKTFSLQQQGLSLQQQQQRSRSFSSECLSFYPANHHTRRATVHQQQQQQQQQQEEAVAVTANDTSFAFYPSQGADRAAYKAKKAAEQAAAEVAAAQQAAKQLAAEHQATKVVSEQKWDAFFAQFVKPSKTKQARMMHTRKEPKA